MDLCHFSDEICVAPQVLKTDLPLRKPQGIHFVICNLPDGEGAARKAGLRKERTLSPEYCKAVWTGRERMAVPQKITAH